jgi:eukaryotic-like serine/threonine-protein kinase
VASPSDPMERFETEETLDAPTEHVTKGLDTEETVIDGGLIDEVRRGGRSAEPSPRTIGDYVVLETLGQGGMGVVYLAKHHSSGQLVALKVIRDGLALTGSRLERFRREGQITASLRHPGIVGIHSAGVDDAGRPFLVYEFIENARTLEEVLPTLDLVGKIEILRDGARALAFAHAEGVVHRDVKPANFLIGDDNQIRVADFGIAAAADLERITRTAALLGTCHYMAPEACEGPRVGPAADVWALGVILYQVLADRHPIGACSWFEYLGKARQGINDPPTHKTREVPPTLGEICVRALTGTPAVRTPTAKEFADQLDTYLSGEALPPRPRRGRALVVAAVVGLGACALALSLLWSKTPPPIAPRLSVAGPVDEALCFNQSEIEIRGRVESSEEWVELRVSGRPTPVRVRPGAFVSSVPLALGRNVIEVQATADGGSSSTYRRTVVRRDVPPWYLELAPARRPSLPLPANLELGDAGFQNRLDGSVLIWIPPTTTRLGNNERDLSPHRPEGPEHEVTLGGYFIGKYELTWDQFRRFERETKQATLDPSFEVEETHPVHGVTWAEANAYCEWAGLRLPTEAEWEHAARGPKRFARTWGDGPLDKTRGNFELPAPDGDRYPTTSPVGTFPRGMSPFGCLDMAGNVWEWMFDRSGPYSAEPQINPQGPDEGTERVIRGGAYSSSSGRAGSATYRKPANPERRSPKIGFRVCFSAADRGL